MTDSEILQRRDFLKAVGMGAAAGILGRSAALNAAGTFWAGRASLRSRTNVLLITTDDLQYDSVGANGCSLSGATPNIDRLASQGVRFEHAHVNIAVCQPCRGTLATGRYPHRSGIRGFEHTRIKMPTVMQTLKNAGYLTGIMSKVGHSTPHVNFEWDMVMTKKDTCNGRSPERFHRYTEKFIRRSQKEGRPFYLMVNAQDPHRPFSGAEKEKFKLSACSYSLPSRTFHAEEVPVPGFLPDLPGIRKEVARYFSSVRRADDTVGEVLRALAETGAEENTIVVFISDHGMSFPFAKACCYPFSTRVPWIVRWPGVTMPGTADRRHFISTIDFFPTILEAVGLPVPQGLDGTSFLPLLKGREQGGRDKVFVQFYRTSKNGVYPMRSVLDKRACYIFNPWSDGRRRFKAEAMQGLTFKAMQEAAQTDPAVAARVNHYLFRTVEELYDLEKDPFCLNNLAGDSAHRSELSRMRNTLLRWMQKTGDSAVECFKSRGEKDACRPLFRFPGRFPHSMTPDAGF